MAIPKSGATTPTEIRGETPAIVLSVQSPPRRFGLLFATTIFTSAFLLFALEPMFSKMLLPRFGGSPAVWNTSLVFYQLVLLGGYAYADLLRRTLTTTRQIIVHGVLVLAAFIFLPVAVPAWLGDPTQTPVLSLLVVASAAIGIPFFVLSANSSLMQLWFAKLWPNADAYALYAASNLGSMLALGAYVFGIEPFVGLTLQSRFWYAGFVLYVLQFAGCALLTVRAGRSTAAISASADLGPRLGAARIVRWVVLAAVPASLMFGVTSFLQDEVAAIPLLWTVPLAAYLLTFVIAFGLRRLVSRTMLARLAVFGLVILAFTIAAGNMIIELAVTLHVVVFFILALYCHTTLRDDRPAEGRLTEFYLWLSVGGAIGGLLSALVGPQLFPVVVEYPVALTVAALLLPDRSGDTSRAARIWEVALPIVLAAGVVLYVVGRSALHSHAFDRVTLFTVLGFVAILVARRALSFGLVIGVMLAAALVLPSVLGDELFRARNFFGVKRVTLAPDLHKFTHGATLHGSESTDPARERVPGTYYSLKSGIGLLFKHLQPRLRGAQIGSVGLGVGTLACFAQPGQKWTYYEIDPQVIAVATDQRLFRYLAACDPTGTIVLGDARIQLAKDTHHQYSLLILDAYTSDQMPVHLLTREAFAVYLSTLTPHGVLAFNITNRFFDLLPVLGNAAQANGLVAYDLEHYVQSPDEYAPDWSASHWVVLAHDPADLNGLLNDGAWRQVPPSETIPLWTDDYTSQLRVWKE